MSFDVLKPINEIARVGDRVGDRPESRHEGDDRGALPVVGGAEAGQQAAGIVSERDLVVEAMARGVPADGVRMGVTVHKAARRY